jgi:2-keto-4-pentenoate hydratase
MTAATSASRSRPLAGALLLACALHARAEPAVELIRNHWQARTVIPSAPAIADEETALNTQRALVEWLTADLGRPVGFKAALTHPAAQQRFGVNHPLLGVLLEKMILPDGAVLPLNFAARPVAEGDLLLRVKDARIVTAQTDLELLAALDAVIPFLELADLGYATNVTPDARAITAINAGARSGVRGAPIPLEASDEQLARLASFTVEVTDGAGTVLARGVGRDVLGHPIHAVRWIRDEILRRGDRLRPGDLLSIGSLTAFIPAREPMRLQAVYHGLRDDEPVTVGVEITRP